MSDAPLHARDVTLAYDREVVARDLTVSIPQGGFTAIVGPNACGKSTLLRALVRMLKPRAGSVLLDGAEISSLPTRQVARRLGLLPQTSTAPDGITVSELVARGRHPYQRLLRQWSREDERAVRDAMAQTAVDDLADRLVDELSGGQRQRVWLAMALAQETPLLLLDEPTTFLDIAHQMEVLDLCAGLHRDGRTLVAVLHDLNHACRYATHLIAMREGAVVAQGDPAEIVDAELVERVFGLPCLVVPVPGDWGADGGACGALTVSPRARPGTRARCRQATQAPSPTSRSSACASMGSRAYTDTPATASTASWAPSTSRSCRSCRPATRRSPPSRQRPRRSSPATSAVCMATSGPGAIHLLNGLYDAKLDHQPVVAIVGQQKSFSLGVDYQQEVDLQSLFKDVASEYVQTCMHPGQIRQLIDRAVKIARVSRSVTAVIVPGDVQEAEFEPPPREHGVVYTSAERQPRSHVTPPEAQLADAAELLNAGEKVAILIGQGARHAAAEVAEVADLLGAGVAKALNGKDALPDDLPFVTGSIGLLGTRPSHQMVMGCDTLLMIGTSFPYAEWLPEPGAAKVVRDRHRRAPDRDAGRGRRGSGGRRARHAASARPAARAQGRPRLARADRARRGELVGAARRAGAAARRPASTRSCSSTSCHRGSRTAACSPPTPARPPTGGRVTSRCAPGCARRCRARSHRCARRCPTRSPPSSSTPAAR